MKKKRVAFRWTKGNKAGFETVYTEDVADILEKRGDGVILDRPKAIIVGKEPKESKGPKKDKEPKESSIEE